MEYETGQQPGWFKRNWMWFVPTAGCGGCLVVGTVVVALIVALGMAAVKSSDAYKGAVARAQQSEPLAAAIGTPITPGFFVQGKIHVDLLGGSANLSIPLSGPKGKATLTAVAYKSGGTWQFSTLEAVVDGTRQRIALVTGEASPQLDSGAAATPEPTPTPSELDSGEKNDW